MPRPIRSICLLFGLVASTEAATPQRCDLVSVPGAAECLDLAKLDGATLRVPLATTRIPSGGLNLCGVSGSVPPPTDIVYLIDNSNSMASWGFWVDPASGDTAWFIPDCQSAKIPGTMEAFRRRHFGAKTGVDSLQWDSLFQMTGTTNPGTVDAKNCLEANDPYSMRAEAVRVAMNYQATFDPAALAGVIFFNKSVKQTFPLSVLDAPGLANLRTGTGLYAAAGGTLWQPPLDSALNWLAATPLVGRSKAIILVSDGEPTDESKYRALLGKAGQPPIYAVYLGKTTDATPQLDYVTSVSGGKKFVVPPAEPDSLASVLQQILGVLIKPAKPDTLRVTNSTNGQTSVAKTSVVNGNAYRMELDSLVALGPGTNLLQLSISEAGKTISANWTVVVGDGAGMPGALDTLLTQRCGAPSSIALAPDKSGSPYAIDSVDGNILIVLHATPDLNSTLLLSLSTRASLDQEGLVMAVPAFAAPDTSGSFPGSIPWQALSATGGVPGDGVVRSGEGWDTLVARFQMPRDPRDTASAILALRRAVAQPILALVPPPFLDLTVPHAVVRSGVLATPPGEAPISVMALQGTAGSDTSSWQTVEGPVLTKTDRDTRIGGVVAHLNRIPQTLGLYIYDNLGVMVLHKDLSDLVAQAAQGNIPQTPSGDYLLWLGWNGLDAAGKPVATGVYVVRIYGWIKEGNQLLLMNQIKRTGFYRDLKN